ncbi:hypothetical protein AG1IA_04552 [Rhizoctonia solani AG-1 IA]|uniref:Uncharacterized protein n=1 Tax=Thanatephorus cucumeris (strain AG1-IA) TaxID=983506 RepID=L8WX69_THACA|nr:hypothetical protein AG1IA_04552 [Rhizoctonia solani AG-1 IA]
MGRHNGLMFVSLEVYYPRWLSWKILAEDHCSTPAMVRYPRDRLYSPRRFLSLIIASPTNQSIFQSGINASPVRVNRVEYESRFQQLAKLVLAGPLAVTGRGTRARIVVAYNDTIDIPGAGSHVWLHIAATG